MNRQVLLWAILAITLLVIVILGAGLWLLRDKTSAAGPLGSTIKPVSEDDYFNLAFQSSPLPGLPSPSPTPEATPSPGIEEQKFNYGPGPSEAPTAPAAEKQTAPAPRSSPSPAPQARQAATRQSTAPRTQPAVKRPAAQYWIQTGSYKSKSKADFCNATLIENGLSGIIIPKTVHGDTYFRVRLGPYPNKAEAEKFLAWIKKIDGFEESYISLNFPAKM